MHKVFAGAALLLALGLAPLALADTGVPVIPRAALFGNPSKAAARLSPDGRWLAWLAPREGVLNVWVAPVGNPADAKALTSETARPIRQYFWTPDSSTILFVNDKGGDENFLLYGVDVASGAQRTLTPFQKTRVEVIGVSRLVKDRILIGLNNRDPRWHDVYSLDLASGALTPLLINKGGYGGFTADESLTIRLADRPRPDGGDEIFRVVGNKVAKKPLAEIEPDDARTTGPAGFTQDGKTLYWLDSRGRDTAALLAQDMASGKTTVIAADAKADIDGTLTDPKTGRVQAYAVDYLKTTWTALDPAIQPDLDVLNAQATGNIAITSRTDADDLWTVTVDNVVTPATTYLYDRKTRTLAKLFVGRPELEGAPLVPMHPLEIRTRDGRTEVSYLTLPPGADPTGTGRPQHPLPMVLLVHGGPWARDEFGYNSYHQWLANRGYAVLSVNYRGSTGFGKAYVAAADHEWGAKMHDDLIDAVDWAVSAGVADPDKVAIMGGSYGGYATLVGMTVTPDRFACGVDIVGPSNLDTLLKSIPAYWESGRAQMYRSMGDPRTAAGRALLHDRSPLFRAAAIKRPLLIGQGANDPRVNRAEADQIVAALDAKSIPVTYIVFPDEGHGFARPENNIAFNAVSEQFLAQCLGGRAEAVGDAVTRSSANLVRGAGNMPGL
jgi:dipeptidyl aminopeptidase/acylaminoacyl peptidase